MALTLSLRMMMPSSPTHATPPAKRTLMFATDRGKSPLAVLGPEGLVQQRYTPYGGQSVELPTHSNLGFNGQLKDESTGWYHLGNGHRVYNPVLMRFHSPDRLSPFGKGGVNGYAYCKNDPVNLEDPTGEFGGAFANLVGNLVIAAKHVNRVTGIISIKRPIGLRGYGTFFKKSGYVAVAAGEALKTVGYPIGSYVSNTGGALLGLGTVIKAMDNVVRFASQSRLARTINRNIRGKFWKRPTSDAALEWSCTTSDNQLNSSFEQHIKIR